MDQSQDLDEEAFGRATEAGPGVYNNRETMLWKNCDAFYKKAGAKDWTRMRGTGQWSLEDGYSVYLTGGQIKKA